MTDHHAPRDEANIHPLSRRLAFIETKAFQTGLLFALGLGALALGLADLYLKRHALFAFEGWTAFHAWFGFLAFSFVVLAGWPLGALLRRREDYYRGGEDDA